MHHVFPPLQMMKLSDKQQGLKSLPSQNTDNETKQSGYWEEILGLPVFNSSLQTVFVPQKQVIKTIKTDLKLQCCQFAVSSDWRCSKCKGFLEGFYSSS